MNTFGQYEVGDHVMDRESGKHGIVREVMNTSYCLVYIVEITDLLDTPNIRLYVRDELRLEPASDAPSEIAALRKWATSLVHGTWIGIDPKDVLSALDALEASRERLRQQLAEAESQRDAARAALKRIEEMSLRHEQFYIRADANFSKTLIHIEWGQVAWLAKNPQALQASAPDEGEAST